MLSGRWHFKRALQKCRVFFLIFFKKVLLVYIFIVSLPKIKAGNSAKKLKIIKQNEKIITISRIIVSINIMRQE